MYYSIKRKVNFHSFFLYSLRVVVVVVVVQQQVVLVLSQYLVSSTYLLTQYLIEVQKHFQQLAAYISPTKQQQVVVVVVDQQLAGSDVRNDQSTTMNLHLLTVHPQHILLWDSSFPYILEMQLYFGSKCTKHTFLILWDYSL